MDKFFCIKLINKNGEWGYVIDGPKGIMISKGGITSNIAQFPTYSDASQFIRDKKLENNRVKAYVRDNNDLIKDEAGSGATPLKKEAYYLETDDGERACYDPKEESYYFKKSDIGYCLFESKIQCNRFIDELKFPFNINIRTISPK